MKIKKYIKLFEEIDFEDDWEFEEEEPKTKPRIKLNFRLSNKAQRDEVYLYLLYEGGDADTTHPETINLGIKYSEIDEHIDEITEIVDKYKRLQKVLNYTGDLHYDRKINRYVIRSYRKDDVKIDDDIEELIEGVPNDPQADYQFKCYLGDIWLIGYDENGDKHTSYI